MGFAPMHDGFADRSVTTSPLRPVFGRYQTNNRLGSGHCAALNLLPGLRRRNSFRSYFFFRFNCSFFILSLSNGLFFSPFVCIFS